MDLTIKAETYDKRPKMRRDTLQKSSLFLKKEWGFCRVSLFISGRLLYVTALVESGYNSTKGEVFKFFLTFSNLFIKGH